MAAPPCLIVRRGYDGVRDDLRDRETAAARPPRPAQRLLPITADQPTIRGRRCEMLIAATAGADIEPTQATSSGSSNMIKDQSPLAPQLH